MLQQQKESFEDNSLMGKIKRLKSGKNMQEILIISILFVVFSSTFFKESVTKVMPFTSNGSGDLSTLGLVVCAVIIAITFIILRTFI